MARTETYRPFATGIVKVYRAGVFVGYRASVWVPDPSYARGGHNVPKRFDKDVTLTDMKNWRVDTRRTAKRTPKILPPERPTGFAGDAAVYLETVRAMPTINDRRLHIGDWVIAFAGKTSAEITSTMIRAQRDRYLTHGPKRVQRRVNDRWTWVLVDQPLAPGTVNKRLRALENMWTVMWPHADNPVREVAECDEPEAVDRGTSFEVVQEILAHMPNRTSPVKGVKHSRSRPSKTRARLAVMLWTGLAHSQLAGLREDVHVDYAAGAYIRPRRKKGRRGTRNRAPKAERPQPLIPQAAAAIKHLFAIGADGTFSRSALYKSWKRAIANANRARVAAHGSKSGKPPLIPTKLRPYDVKHTFGGEAYRSGKDLRAVQELLGLSRLELADRYAHTAVAPAAAAAAAALAIRAGETSPANLTFAKNTQKMRAGQPAF